MAFHNRNFLMLMCALLCQSFTYGEDISAEEQRAFNHHVNIHHKLSGEKFTVNSTGVVRHHVILDREPVVKRLLCKGNTIFLACYTERDRDELMSKLKVGDLLSGGSHWMCDHLYTNDEQHKQGFHVKIQKISKNANTNRVIRIDTQRASFFDLFHEANIHIEHFPGDWSDIPDDEHERHKRSLLGSVTNLFMPIEWHKNASYVFPINYNEERDTAEEIFGVYNGEIKHFPNTIKSLAAENEDETKFDWSIECYNCYAYFKAGLIFDLQISNDKNFRHFMLQLVGEVKGNIDVSALFDGELSRTVSIPVFLKGPYSLPSMQLVPAHGLIPSIRLQNDFTFTVYLNAELKALASGTFRKGADLGGSLTLTIQKGVPGYDEFFSYQFTPLVPTNHPEELDLQASLHAAVSFVPEVSWEASVNWSWEKFQAYSLSLHAPLNFSLVPQVTLESSAHLSTKSVCVKMFTQLDLMIKCEDVNLHVTLLGSKWWDKPLVSLSFTKQYELVAKRPLICKDQCCFVSTVVHSETPRDHRPIDEVCQPISKKITRYDPEFDSLIQMKGDSIIFMSEEKSHSWCGKEGRACMDCTQDIIGTSNEEKCADRMMSDNMAVKLNELAELVIIQYGNRKLIVEEAWDEATSVYPQGRHSPDSLHYEGRAAMLTISRELTEQEMAQLPNDAPESNRSVEITDKLGQLAVASGFCYVKIMNRGEEDSRHVLAGVDRSVIHSDESLIDRMVRRAGERASKAACDKYQGKWFPLLTPGTHYPGHTSKTGEQYCGKINDRITREEHEDFEMLYFFAFGTENITFSSEERDASWCGSAARPCVDCRQKPSSGDKSLWYRCADRVMSLRAAVRLYRVGALLTQEWPDNKLLVLEAWDEPTSDHPQGLHPDGSLHYEGRALQLAVTNDNSGSKLAKLGSLASCAGFDYVESVAGKPYITAYVYQQSAEGAVMVPFINTRLLAISPPSGWQHEYDWPEELASELKRTYLFDSDGKEDNKLSEHFYIRDFLCPGKRYFRLNEQLVQCLQQTRDALKESYVVIPGSAYRTRSANIDNIEERHPEEMWRFQTGEAVEIRPKVGSQISLLHLGQQLIKSCISELRVQQKGLGIGAHHDRLYVDVRPTTLNHSAGEMYIEYWSVDKPQTPDYSQDLDTFQQMLKTGGPEVSPLNPEQACKNPPLGDKLYYYIFSLDKKFRKSCQSRAVSEFCSSSKSHRENVLKKLVSQVNKKLNQQLSTSSSAYQNMKKCVVDACGKCAGSGSLWQDKVRSCAEAINYIVSQASTPFPALDHMAFFNMDDPDSQVYGMACKQESACVETTELYSLFGPVIQAVYRPDPTSSVEERLYGSTDNPSPLLDIVEQELAYRALGTAKIYIEDERDISALHNTMKILMVYNKNISDVQIFITSDVNEDNVIEAVQRKQQYWSGTSCPKWSRFNLAPVTIRKLSHQQIRRSAGLSEKRNAMKRRMHNFEFDWLMKL